MIKKETIQLDEQLLIKACETILNKYGLDFSGSKLKDLNNAITNTSKESLHKSPFQIVELLNNDKLSENEADILLKNLTVGETYFFRDEKLFNALQENKAKEFFEKKRNINIWSAGCSSGEEPYSIAILLDRLYGNDSKTKFNIFASDINKHSIDKAKKGTYRDWSFRSTPQWVKDEYFSKDDDGNYEISEKIKDHVEFVLLNLSDLDKVKNNFIKYDIIICRNVLIYFSKPFIKELIDTFYQKLNLDGIFITTASESINVNKNLFEKFFENNNAIFTKKNSISVPPVILENRNKIETQIKPIVKKLIPAKKILIKKSDDSILDINILYKQALEEYSNNKFLNSLKLFQTAERENKTGDNKLKDEAELYFYLIKCFMKLGDHDKAQSLCETILSEFNLDYRIHYLYGILLQEIGEFIKSEEAFNKSIYLNSKFPLSYFELANLQLSVGKDTYKRNFNKSVKMLHELDKEEIIKYSDGISAGYLLKQITQHID